MIRSTWFSKGLKYLATLGVPNSPEFLAWPGEEPPGQKEMISAVRRRPIDRAIAVVASSARQDRSLPLDNDTILAMPRIRLLPEHNARQGFADAKQIAAICRHLSPDLADAVRFMFITGWRSRSEVLPLRWPQVDLAAGFVRLDPGTTKNSEGRAFPLIPELRVLLERRQAITRRCERAQGRIIAHVFHRYGRPIKSLRRAWVTACRKAGRPGLLPHDLRRSAVRNLERAGISRSVAMKLTGHKTEAVYRRFAIVAENDLREAGAKLAVQLGTDPPTASLSYSLGDISVTARKERSLHA